MRSIFALAHRHVLERFARANVLLAFDYDGTLAPIAETPDGARMRDETRALLTELCRLHPCAVISGRSVRDLQAHLVGVEVAHMIGNHGMEPSEHLDAFEASARAMIPAFMPIVAAYPGVELEDKRYSLSLHYRRATNKRAARDALRDAAAALPAPARVVLGKQVINVVPAGAPDKGSALLALRERLGAETALFVGDDVTDEDVFRIDQPDTLLTIRVGVKKTSAAAFAIPSQRDIDALLRRLIALRQGGAQGDSGASTTLGSAAR